MCYQAGKRVMATVVDHIVPHKGDSALFWDSKGNWQSLCPTHHNAAKQKQEHTGKAIGCDASGQPLEPTHHWNAEAPAVGGRVRAREATVSDRRGGSPSLNRNDRKVPNE
jgi:5-methylcytosine-specific restriction protein A